MGIRPSGGFLFVRKPKEKDSSPIPRRTGREKPEPFVNVFEEEVRGRALSSESPSPVRIHLKKSITHSWKSGASSIAPWL